jgi:hypothetical protein
MVQELADEMKHYEVTEQEAGEEWATLRCPRSDCEEEFKVRRKPFKESRKQIGRSCPYCFRPSAIPGAEINRANLVK